MTNQIQFTMTLAGESPLSRLWLAVQILLGRRITCRLNPSDLLKITTSHAEGRPTVYPGYWRPSREH